MWKRRKDEEMLKQSFRGGRIRTGRSEVAREPQASEFHGQELKVSPNNMGDNFLSFEDADSKKHIAFSVTVLAYNLYKTGNNLCAE